MNDASFPRLITLEHARELIRAQFAGRVLGSHEVPLAAALGRVLAANLCARRDVPGYVHSAMDGYAVRALDLEAEASTRLRCVGTMLAGARAPLRIAPGECVRVMTGAALPDGADTVVIQEHAQVEGDRVTLAAGTTRGANVRASHDDYAAGDLAVASGTRLGAAELGVARALGQVMLTVRQRPRVAVVITGDELATPGEELGFGQRYDSNGPMLAALLAECGADVVAVRRVRDDADLIAQTLRELALVVDLLLTSGGVSVGEADHLPGVVERDGAIVFWKVRMRPGMPVLFGRLGGTPLFSLPGNPVAVYATFLRLVRLALAVLSDAPVLDPPPLHARLADAVDKRHDRVEFRRARLECSREGALSVHLHSSTSSGALSSVVDSDCLAELAPEARRFEVGEPVPVYRLPGRY